MNDTAAGLEGIRILIVEDEAAISLILEEMLTDFGCVIAGIAGKLAQAETMAKAETIDIAVLDVNIAGQEVYPVADILQTRGVPMIFTTGYGDSGVRSEYHHCAIIQKPFRLTELRCVIEKAYNDSRT